MLGRAVLQDAHRAPAQADHQPSFTPLMNFQARSPGPTFGWPYCAVGMHRALDSSIGLPMRSTRASRMVGVGRPPT